eukprot:TRINITY_DN1972_c0_g1_i4.p1 TRINITY_DN1972_c0_g1~~TRINITY_DN1972_c0_g1_i4.p1  ORF type:complete len:343 (+),score=8.96 TRINITY_DN1972_c0_g1_i4:684-1712(+)
MNMDDLLSGPPVVPPSRRSHRADGSPLMGDGGGGGHREPSRSGARGGGGGEPPLPPSRGRFSSVAPLPSMPGPPAYGYGRGLGHGHGPPEGPVYGRPMHHDARRHGEAGTSPGAAAPYSEMGPPPQSMLPPPPPPPPGAQRSYPSPQLLRGLGPQQGAHHPTHLSVSRREGGGMERGLGSSPYGAVHPSIADGGYGNGMPRPLLPPLSTVSARSGVYGEPPPPLSAPPGSGPHGWGTAHGGHPGHPSRAQYYGRPDGPPAGAARLPIPPPPPPRTATATTAAALVSNCVPCGWRSPAGEPSASPRRVLSRWLQRWYGCDGLLARPGRGGLPRQRSRRRRRPT